MNSQGRQEADAGHERRDVDVLNLLLIAGLLLIMIGVCLLICLGILRQLSRARASGEKMEARKPPLAQEFPEPRLIVKPGRELAEVNRAAEMKLTTYGWVDKASGRVRIPIVRAMELLVERGLPEVGGGQTRLQLMQSHSGGAVQSSPPPATPAREPSP